MSFISALYVHYIHALTLEGLRDKVDLAVRGLMSNLEGEPSGRIDLQGRPFRAKVQDFPEFNDLLNEKDAHFHGLHGLWVQAVVYYPGR